MKRASNREKILNGSAKWTKIFEKIKAKGVFVDGKKAKIKWDWCLGAYKVVCNHNKANGNEPYEHISVADINATSGLPTQFDTE